MGWEFLKVADVNEETDESPGPTGFNLDNYSEYTPIRLNGKEYALWGISCDPRKEPTDYTNFCNVYYKLMLVPVKKVAIKSQNDSGWEQDGPAFDPRELTDSKTLWQAYIATCDYYDDRQA